MFSNEEKDLLLDVVRAKIDDCESYIEFDEQDGVDYEAQLALWTAIYAKIVA